MLLSSPSSCFSFRCVGGNIVLLIQAFRKKFIIPEFDVFAQKIDEIYNTVQKQSDGKVCICCLSFPYCLETECRNIKSSIVV